MDNENFQTGDDIELDNLSENVIFSVLENETSFVESATSETLFVRPSTPDSSKLRLSSRFLTYLRQNYLKIFIILILIIITLTLALGLFIYFYLSYYHLTISNDGPNSEFIDNNVLNYTNYDVHGLPCSKFNCKTIVNPCSPTAVTYRNIRIYACCSCAPYQMKRYSEYQGVISVVFIYDNACNLSEYDLAGLAQLKNLEGTWGLLREGDTECYLTYVGVSVPSLSPDDIE